MRLNWNGIANVAIYCLQEKNMLHVFSVINVKMILVVINATYAVAKRNVFSVLLSSKNYLLIRYLF